MIKNLSCRELEKIVNHIGVLYKKSVLRNNSLTLNEQGKTYKDDKQLICAINSCLNECSKDTKCIIENEYLKNMDNYWYLEYYTKSTFYRLKKKAVKEFIDCMDI